MVNLLGAGFVGRRYAQLYPCVVNDRDDLTVKSARVLYMISTVHNYHVTTNPYIDIETNLTTLIRVLEQCRHLGPIEFNFVSSWFVYGACESKATESTVCNPQGFYSITKRTAEQLLIEYCQTFDIQYRILRLANVLGPGDRKAGAKKNALTHVIQKIKQNQPIELQSGGHFCRDYIHVDDACTAINLVMSHGELNSVWNIGNNVSTEFRQAVDYVVNQTDSTSQIQELSNKPVPTYHGIDCGKLFELGYRPQWSMQQILDQLITE